MKYATDHSAAIEARVKKLEEVEESKNEEVEPEQIK
jgi:hypothetical protein